MTCCEQFLSKFGEVVDLTVEHHGDRSVFIKERLMAIREINNRQTAMCQADPGFYMESILIGSPVKLDPVHPGEQ
jgi:hypothetical protein